MFIICGILFSFLPNTYQKSQKLRKSLIYVEHEDKRGKKEKGTRVEISTLTKMSLGFSLIRYETCTEKIKDINIYFQNIQKNISNLI